jgi:tartrate/fumarate subfamily iron-sulfur-dependent hydro-lyase beta chain
MAADMIDLTLPLDEAAVRALRAGDAVRLSGTVVTARDAAHKYIVNDLIQGKPAGADRTVRDRLAGLLAGGCIYHCGPVMRRRSDGEWECLAGGPTTSIREEPYAAEVIRTFGLRGVIGKGGMGPCTAAALSKYGAVYLHAVGGAAVVAAASVMRVTEVLRLDLGMPEAMWVLELKGFPTLVTMDTHGRSIHDEVRRAAEQRLSDMLAIADP